jgi:hypothetical protein
VERWFAELTNKKLRRSTHHNTRELANDIIAWVEHYNTDPRSSCGVRPLTKSFKT